MNLLQQITYLDPWDITRRNLSEVPGPTSVTGGDGKEATPVPISNTEVKLFSVDGTAWETVWESRTPPVLF